MEGVARLEALWRGLRRRNVFPVTLRSLIGLTGRSNFMVDPRGVRQLLEDDLGGMEKHRIPGALRPHQD